MRPQAGRVRDVVQVSSCGEHGRHEEPIGRFVTFEYPDGSLSWLCPVEKSEEPIVWSFRDLS